MLVKVALKQESWRALHLGKEIGGSWSYFQLLSLLLSSTGVAMRLTDSAHRINDNKLKKNAVVFFNFLL